MTFKEFTKACKKDPRLMELFDRCHPECGEMSAKDNKELEERCKAIMEHKRE